MSPRAPGEVRTDLAAIYVRQSITRDGSVSMSDQIAECERAAQRLGLAVAHVVQEKPSTSGYKERGRGRPGFLHLLDLIETHQVDCVVAYKTDRLSRGGGPGWAPLVDAFESVGRNIDRAVATPGGWVSEFEIGIRATTDREESKKTSDRMRMVRAREAKEGRPRPSGRRPYGYSPNWMTVIDAEAAIIKEAALRVLTGESLWSMVHDLNKRQVPTVVGGEWSVNVLHTVLVSGRVAGYREHLGEIVAKGTWPAILSEDVHHEVRLALAAKRRWTKPQPRSYYLVGILRCSKCGGPLRSLARGKNRARSYGCRKLPALGGCGGISIKAEPVEGYVRDLVLGMLADPATRSVLAALVAEGEPGDAHDPLGDEIRAVDHKRERLLDLYEDAGIDKKTYLRRKTALDEDQATLERRLAARSQGNTLVGLPASYEALLATWDQRGIDFQRLLVETVLEPIVVKPGVPGHRGEEVQRLALRPRA